MTSSCFVMMLLTALSAAPATTAIEGNWVRDESLPASPLEEALIADCRDGVLERHSLLRAAAIAGGASADSLRTVCDTFEAQAAPVCASTVGTGQRPAASTAGQARRLLEAMHRRILVGRYRADCSSLETTVSRGDYNCVTATIAYQILCDTAGVRTHAIAVPAHVFARLDESGLDVQTTCSTWLGPGVGRASAAETGARRRLTKVQLLGKVYYNRGVVALQSDDFDEAVRVLRISLILDPGDTIAQKNLLAAVNNWSLAESRQGRYASAVELLSIGRALDPDYAPLVANDLHVHQQWVQSLCRAGRYGFALGILEDGLRRRPDSLLFDRGRYAVVAMWAGDCWQRGELQKGFEVLERPWDGRELEQATINAASSAAAHLTRHARKAAARELLQAVQERVHHPHLQRLANQYAAQTEMLQTGMLQTGMLQTGPLQAGTQQAP